MPSSQWTNNLKYEPLPPSNLPTLKESEFNGVGITGEISKVDFHSIALAAETVDKTVVYVLK